MRPPNTQIILRALFGFWCVGMLIFIGFELHAFHDNMFKIGMAVGRACGG